MSKLNDLKNIEVKIGKINDKLNLSFSSLEHRYTINGVKLVTSATGFISDGTNWGNIPNIETYAHYGTLMHEFAELHAKGEWENGVEEIHEDTLNQIQGYLDTLKIDGVPSEILNNFWEQLENLHEKYKPLTAEQIIALDFNHVQVFNQLYPDYENFNCGGMIDLLCTFNDKLCVLDYKTSASITQQHKDQINFYAYVLKVMYDVKVEELRLVKIDKKTGDLKVSKIKIKEPEEFITWFEEKLHGELWKK